MRKTGIWLTLLTILQNNDHFGKDKKFFLARPANLAPDPEPEEDPDNVEYPDEFSEESYDQGYCVAVLNIADEADHRLGVCFQLWQTQNINGGTARRS